MSFEENFLYPLYLLLIAGSLTGVAIPLFHRYLEWRQKKSDIKREDRKLAYDRNREDYQNELNVKNDLIREISAYFSEVASDGLLMQSLDDDVFSKYKKTKFMNSMESNAKSMVLVCKISALVPMFFQNANEILEKTKNMTKTMNSFNSTILDGYTQVHSQTIFEGMSTINTASLTDNFSQEYVDQILKNPTDNTFSTLFQHTALLFTILIQSIHNSPMKNPND